MLIMAAVAQPPGVDTDSAIGGFNLGCHKNHQRIIDSHVMGMDVGWVGESDYLNISVFSQSPSDSKV